MRSMTSRILVPAAVIASISAMGLTLRAQAPASAAVASPSKPAALDRAALESKVDELVNGYIKANNFSGAVLLAREGEPLLAKGYGFANAEWQIPNTSKTKFRIGSITKQFTSMLVMQLREQGRLKVEDSVCLYVKPCPDAWKPVTIHHLLTHTSGIPTYTAIAAWREGNMVPRTVDQVVAFFRDLPLQWAPGEKYAYNNSGYFLLGLVIEKVTGQKFEQALKDMILTPMGMADTGYDWSSTILPHRASGYSGRGNTVVNAAALDMQQPYAAGAMYSTVEDLLKWDQALYTEKLLPEASKQLMWTPNKENYGYGWMIGQPAAGMFGGHKRLAHGGGINGFSTVIVRLPETRTTVIVLANTDTVNSSLIGRDVMAIYYGDKYTLPEARTVAKVDPLRFDRYLGKYELRPDFIVTVAREGNSLFLQGSGQPRFEVQPESETKFFSKAPAVTIEFAMSPEGKVTHALVTQGGTERTAKKIE